MPPAVRRCHRKQALKFLRTRQRKRQASQLPQFSGRVLRWWSITSHPACLCLAGESEVLMHNLHPKCNCQPSSEGKLRDVGSTLRTRMQSREIHVACPLRSLTIRFLLDERWEFLGDEPSPSDTSSVQRRRCRQQPVATTGPWRMDGGRTGKTVFHWVSVR